VSGSANETATRFGQEDDAAAIDAHHLGDALHDREQDVADIEARGERLGELEQGLLLPIPARQPVEVLPDPHLHAQASQELTGPERFLHVIVRAARERTLDLAVRFEGRQHHDRHVGEARSPAHVAEDGVPIRLRHHEVQQNRGGRGVAIEVR